MALLVGSAAARHWFGHRTRRPGTWDVWATTDQVGPLLAEIAGAAGDPDGVAVGATLRIADRRRTYSVIVVSAESAKGRFIAANAKSEAVPGAASLRIARPQSLLLIKRGHLCDPKAWHKHIDDYHFLRRRVRPGDASAAEHDAFAAEIAETRAARGSGSDELSMKIRNEVFFGTYKDGAVRFYEHDDLHRATCYYGRPLYLALKDDPDLAFVPEANFRRLPDIDKLRLVREECYALALERAVIPARELGIDWPDRSAFLHGLRRICTDLARGWFRDFAIERFPEIVDYDVDFVRRFDAAVRSGAIVRRRGPSSASERQAVLDYLARLARKDEDASLAPGARTSAAIVRTRGGRDLSPDATPAPA